MLATGCAAYGRILPPMPECTEIGLMLGPFEDGELEPHEMQEVARHLARCDSCEHLLGDYNAIGRALRNAAPIVPLTNFAQAVDARIAAMRLPLGVRIREMLRSAG